MYRYTLIILIRVLCCEHSTLQASQPNPQPDETPSPRTLNSPQPRTRTRAAPMLSRISPLSVVPQALTPEALNPPKSSSRRRSTSSSKRFYPFFPSRRGPTFLGGPCTPDPSTEGEKPRGPLQHHPSTYITPTSHHTQHTNRCASGLRRIRDPS